MKIKILLLLSTILLLGGATPAEAARQDDPLRFRAATLNIQANMPLDHSADDARRAANQGADAIAFQEIGGEGKEQVIRDVLDNNGYSMLRFDDTPAAESPVAWKTSEWVKDDAFRWHLSDDTFVGKDGAGPATLRAKEATVVILHERGTGRRVVFASLHLAPMPYLNERRAALHREQVAALRTLAHRMDWKYPAAEVIFAGDFNTDDPSLLDPICMEGLKISEQIRTHEHGALDRVLSTVQPRDAYTIGGLHTDHKLLVVTTREAA